MLHGILRVRKAVLRDDVRLVVLKVTLTVRLAQARRGVALVVSLMVLLVSHLLRRGFARCAVEKRWSAPSLGCAAPLLGAAACEYSPFRPASRERAKR